MTSAAVGSELREPRAGWLDRVAGLRDQLLASSGFRRRAAAFALTRPVARRRTRGLFDLCAGFVYSQVLLACARLDLPRRLLEAPRTAEALAPLLALSPDATERLLAAATALRIARRRGGGRYGLGPLGAALVDNPALAAMIEHHTLLYDDRRDPLRLLRGDGDTQLARYWPYADQQRAPGLGAGEVAPYTALMSASQSLIASEVLDAYRLGRHRCLLDVGGGDGTFLAAAAARAPALRLVLFDLPPVAARARARFAALGLADRAQAVGGDFLRDALPGGADLVSLVRVLHDHDDDAALRLLRAIRRALAPGGTLLLAEPMSGTRGAEPVGDAYFGFYLLAMGSGQPRTPRRVAALLREAEFARVRLTRTHTPLLARLIIAR